MPRLYPVVAVLCAVLCVLLVWSTGVQSALFAPPAGEQARGAPQLRVEVTRQDLGNISARPTLPVQFEVINDGTRRAVLRKQTGHCCGASGSDEITIVSPGGSVTLTHDFDTAGIHGGFQQDVVYSTNDPRLPELRVTVVARLENDQ